MNQVIEMVRTTRFFGCALLLACAVFTGCGKTDSPQFKLNLPKMELTTPPITVEQQQTIANALVAMFGTPDEPYVLPESGLDLAKIRLAAGPVASDQVGVQRGLYRQHCVHCHGTTGDGMGPTASILDPYPRDYRPGLYKYKSTDRAAMPTHADLTRILREGVMGTAMPSFALLAPSEIDALVEYVRYLSLRGQVETKLIAATADLGVGEKLTLDRALLVDDILTTESGKWSTATEQIINPADRPEIALEDSIHKGRELFYGAKANCVKCHGPTALGDGVTTDYDDWNKPLGEKVDGLKKAKDALASLKSQRSSASDGDAIKVLDEQIASAKEQITSLETLVNELQSQMLPLRTITPRNLRLGIYRFGRRPLDLYRRMHSGINGAPMPGTNGTLQPDEMWSLVDYIRSLPFEPINRVQPGPKVAGLSQH
jgi:mono/diheme cytochrome c family protein